MASRDHEEPFNTETDEETIALRKKRSRRVSFADREITSVHIFNRDEDYETPPDSSKRSSAENAELVGPDNELIGFFKDLADSDDSKDLSLIGDDYDDDDDVVRATKSFLRPIESPSPGSSIVGSATSNDEDNFFGPVSASFIRPGRLSDSSALDFNHDVTMDSTAFSMHFRSLARSESGGDFKTPTGGRLAFEEKTPSDSGSFMVLTKSKNLIPKSLLLADKVSGGRDSNDMSLVGENSHKYDYGRLSPRLEALLAEGTKDLLAASGFHSTNSMSLKRSEVSAFVENGSGHKDSMDCGDPETSNVAVHDMSAEGVSVPRGRLSESNGGSLTTAINQIAHDCSANTKESPGADASFHRRTQTPNQLNSENKELIKAVIGMNVVNADFPAVYSGTPPNMESKVLQLGLFTQQELGHQRTTEDWLKENSPINRRLSSDADQISAQEHGSPLAGSISSLSAKRKQIFLDTANSSKHSSYVTPSPKQPGFFLSKESTKEGDAVPSIQKSNTKFNVSQSKLRLPEYFPSKASPFNTVMEDNMKNPQRKHLDVPIINLEEQLLSADGKNKEHKSMINMNSDDIGTAKDIGSLSQHEEVAGLAKNVESVDNVSTHILCKEITSQIMTAMASPTQFTWSGKNVMRHLSMSERPKEGTMVISELKSSPVEITLDHRKDKKLTDVSNKFVSPQVKRLDEKLSTELQSSISSDLKQQGRYNKFSGIGSGQDENSIENVTSGWSSAIADKLKRRGQSILPVIEINPFKDSTQAKSVDDGESYPPELHNVSESFRNFQTPSRDRGTLKFQSGSPDKNLQIATELTQSKGDLPRDDIKAAACASASPYVCRSSDKPTLWKLSQSLSRNNRTQNPTWKEPIRSQSRIELLTASHDDNRQPFVGKDILSPKSNADEHCYNDCHEGLYISPSTTPGPDIENSSRQKRRIEEIVLRDADHEAEISRMQTSAKVHKSVSCDMEFMLGHSNGSNNGKEKTGSDTALKHWTDMSLKFSSDTNQLHSSLVNKLNIRAIGMLEDILSHLQKVKIYEMLCSEIHFQKVFDHSSFVRHKRVAETKSLLYKIVYEKAKLQLMCVKRERLQKRVQLLSSGVQETQMLKLNNIPSLSVSGERDTQVKDNFHDLDLVNIDGKHEFSSDKVTTMRHEFEAIDRKIKNLTKSLHTYCKTKGESSCADTIVLLKDHLKQRMYCRFIRQDLQLWEVDDLQSSNGHHNVVLNYHGFICQRVTINSGPVLGICILNKLNDINIMKNFPNMDACTAFAFLLQAETTKKYVDSKSLAQETQSTSSLLHNLLDVVEEVQLARIEIRNLTQTSFQTPSAQQLDLQLYFIDFNSGRKVTMTLDLTCLKCGIYPSEILPYQLQAPTTSTEKLMPHFLSADIKAAVESLRVGNSRILRLCRCVSQVVQSGSR